MIVNLCNNVSRLNQAVEKNSMFVDLLRNKMTLMLVELLLKKRIIDGFNVDREDKIRLRLRPRLRFRISMLSKPSRRIYLGCSDLAKKSFESGFWVLSTSRRAGLTDSFDCLREGVGGLVLCKVLFF